MPAKPILAQPPVLTNQNIIPSTDGPQADPLGGYEIVINGEATLWADTEAEAWEAYHSFYQPQPIVWQFHGQSILLEVA